MTRLAVFADIHGNLPALEAVLDDLVGRGIDQIVVLGDSIIWVPFDDEVLERITGEGWPVIRGNHEFYLTDFQTPRAFPAWSDPVRYAPVHNMVPPLIPKWRQRVATWPDTLTLRFGDAPPVRLFHGLPENPWKGISPSSPAEQVTELLGSIAERFILAAHTHMPLDRTIGRWRIINPGSVGVPLDGNQAAQYAILDGNGEGWTPTFRRVPYDIKKVFDAYVSRRFVEEIGVMGKLAVEEMEMARVRLTPFNSWRAAERPNEPITWDLHREFLTIDPRPYINDDFFLPGPSGS